MLNEFDIIRDVSSRLTKEGIPYMMSRSPEERFMMGIRSFDAAREMVLASLPKNLSKEELGRRLFERVYGAPLADFVKGSSLPDEDCP